MKIELNDPLFLPHCSCDISFEISSGTGFLILGENGIGKSTLLSAIHKIIGVENSAFLPQKELDFFSDRKLRVLKNIFLRSHPVGLDLYMFEKLWSDFFLNSKEDRHLSQLSGGEAQSLKICLTLSKNTNYFLLDEPFQFLDQTRRAALGVFLRDLMDRKKTVILVEHQIEPFQKGWQLGHLYDDQGVLKLREEWTT